jgi:hypothetical protein
VPPDRELGGYGASSIVEVTNVLAAGNVTVSTTFEVLNDGS